MRQAQWPGNVRSGGVMNSGGDGLLATGDRNVPKTRRLESPRHVVAQAFQPAGWATFQSPDHPVSITRPARGVSLPSRRRLASVCLPPNKKSRRFLSGFARTVEKLPYPAILTASSLPGAIAGGADAHPLSFAHLHFNPFGVSGAVGLWEAS